MKIAVIKCFFGGIDGKKDLRSPPQASAKLAIGR
jgi:hypothetical protein